MSAVLVGLDVTASAAPGADPVGTARAAERLGFDFVSAPDHPCGTAPTYETWTMLTWIAASTSRVAMVTRVLAVPMRNPALVAKMAESLHRLSGGRLVLGLGGGYADDEFRAFGLPVPTAREKVDGLEDAVRIARALWSESAVSHGGSVYRTDHADIEPKPANRIPIWLGTFGPRALAMTGRLADGWIPSLGSAGVDQLPVLRKRLLAAATEAGRRPEDITCALNLSIGTDPAVGADLTGTPAAIADQLAGFVQEGFTAFNLQLPDGADLEVAAAEILPAVRAAGRPPTNRTTRSAAGAG